MNSLANMIRADRRALLQIAGGVIVYLAWTALLFSLPALVMGK